MPLGTPAEAKANEDQPPPERELKKTQRKRQKLLEEAKMKAKLLEEANMNARLRELKQWVAAASAALCPAEQSTKSPREAAKKKIQNLRQKKMEKRHRG